MSQLHRLCDDFAGHNPLLQALLGILSRTQWVERLPIPPPGGQPPAASNAPEPFVAMLLGLVSIRRALLDLTGVESDDPPHPRRVTEIERPIPTDLLR